MVKRKLYHYHVTKLQYYLKSVYEIHEYKYRKAQKSENFAEIWQNLKTIFNV